MNRHALLLSAALLLGTAAHAATDHGHRHDHTPQHGGIVVEVREIEYELVAQPELIRLHLRDHGESLDVSRSSARLTLLSAGEKQDVDLKPAGEWLEATGHFKLGPGTKAVVVVQREGKASTARFSLK